MKNRELNRELKWELSLQAGWKLSTSCWTIEMEAECEFGIVLFNFHERSELTSIFNFLF